MEEKKKTSERMTTDVLVTETPIQIETVEEDFEDKPIQVEIVTIPLTGLRWTTRRLERV